MPMAAADIEAAILAALPGAQVEITDLAGLGVGVNDIKAMLAEKLAQAEAQISGAA